MFLDRDGVLNRALGDGPVTHPPASLEDLEVLPGAAEACRELRQHGFLLIVVSNQPDVARGTMSVEQVECINRALAKRVPLDDFYICYHTDSDGCECRKPRPGMLLAAAEKWNIDLQASFMIGDRWKDVQAGRNAGCKSVLIDYQRGDAERCPPDQVFQSLAEAARWLLQDSN